MNVTNKQGSPLYLSKTLFVALLLSSTTLGLWPISTRPSVAQPTFSSAPALRYSIIQLTVDYISVFLSAYFMLMRIQNYEISNGVLLTVEWYLLSFLWFIVPFQRQLWYLASWWYIAVQQLPGMKNKQVDECFLRGAVVRQWFQYVIIGINLVQTYSTMYSLPPVSALLLHNSKEIQEINMHL